MKRASLDYLFVIDADGELFNSPKYKTGRMSIDSDTYEIIEFSSSAAVGKPTEPSLHKQTGSATLNTLEIVKTEGGKRCIVFKETANSPEWRAVQ